MAKNGLDKWFKQKWVDIGSKKKGGSFINHVEVQNLKKWKQEEVSKMRACLQSSTDDRLSEADLPLQDEKELKHNGGPKPTNVKTFAKAALVVFQVDTWVEVLR